MFFYIFYLKNLSGGYSCKHYFAKVKLEPRHQDGSKFFFLFYYGLVASYISIIWKPRPSFSNPKLSFYFIVGFGK